jgi:hypothetical protein
VDVPQVKVNKTITRMGVDAVGMSELDPQAKFTQRAIAKAFAIPSLSNKFRQRLGDNPRKKTNINDVQWIG